MTDLINDFWKWANISPEQYAKQDFDLDEGDYPHFNKLLNYAMAIIDKSEASTQELNDLLTILALDNENEDVLDYLTSHCDNDKLDRLVKLGVVNVQPNTRWQIAELLYRRKPYNYEKYILQLSQDEHFYVRKRANNLLDYLNLA